MAAGVRDQLAAFFGGMLVAGSGVFVVRQNLFYASHNLFKSLSHVSPQLETEDSDSNTNLNTDSSNKLLPHLLRQKMIRSWNSSLDTLYDRIIELPSSVSMISSDVQHLIKSRKAASADSSNVPE
mmetsp:Transcript_1376/g.2508  ORF Transcript_1376/g.2508 Transcript_1376/m.2508 type:complete len:125 (-) Transcript_1376:268-642(-)|eukprot:CAMPEP_0182446706 /NCGR_PEP_ID=MMETSP1172-20130603/4721_1 /TAXON_ID=708627 /ORGANISM="Timspurckia oligopyrenoides, Strain CCMP3278" /LENGTH=124 /DNA_ID=CAMNT_0024642705 /DNA_START=71 /DNA_END=445 /DNA_ORIENTATION=+